MNIAIVIPVGPNYAHLKEQLAAVSAQQLPAGVEPELILSCNGSDPERIARILHLSADWDGWSLRVIDSSERRGPGHARNAGWRAARSENVLFCDADDVVAPGWIVRLSEALADAEVVGGVFEYLALNPRGVGSWGEVGTSQLPVKFAHLPFVPSGNLGARRNALERLNGFDESLARSEDVDFSWRAIYAGFTIGLAPEALLHVRRRQTWGSLFTQAREDASFDVPLLARHRQHGARWSALAIAREGAGVFVALALSPFGKGQRAKLATRSGRFLGHLSGACRMLAR